MKYVPLMRPFYLYIKTRNMNEGERMGGKRFVNDSYKNSDNPTKWHHCHKNEHFEDQCWKLHLELIPQN